MDNWLVVETIGDAQDMSTQELTMCLDSIYATENQLPLLEFEIDGVPYVVMSKQNFVDWYGE